VKDLWEPVESPYHKKYRDLIWAADDAWFKGDHESFRQSYDKASDFQIKDAIWWRAYWNAKKLAETYSAILVAGRAK
jgi:hypothetical protein